MKCLCINGSLKARASDSNTEVLCEMLAKELGRRNVETETVFLNELEIATGVAVNPMDDMHGLFRSIYDSEILVLATPIWWNQPSSLIQKVLERMTAFDDFYIQTDRSLLYGKTLGVLVSGTDDGAQSCFARLLGFANHLGFTIPPEAWASSYKQGRKEIEGDEGLQSTIATMARNLAAWSEAIEESGVVGQVQGKSGKRTGTVASDARKLLDVISEKRAEKTKSLGESYLSYLRSRE